MGLMDCVCVEENLDSIVGGFLPCNSDPLKHNQRYFPDRFQFLGGLGLHKKGYRKSA